MAFDAERERTAWALESAARLLPEDVSRTRVPQVDVWVLAHGFSNAFYSITEMIRHTDKQRDPLAYQLAWDWLENGASDLIKDYNNNFRNALTHQGRFELRPVSAWTPAEEGEAYTIYQTSYGREGEMQRTYTFRGWTFYCFTWLAEELAGLAAQHDAASTAPFDALQQPDW